ncbi:DUF5017 domain-containing protein [Niabella ginsengisoli]|uniref:DUF5017 domain-containing protein n=1 Tax=Niabella ginsengisoli TaxID=522298 RepID=A0ABS9SJ63_9BACT|nr:DUF5017 domain-containing protein [Niabella ginsengisoli]MCH5598407.1 DUF5017 domain-containing protein [Niabella ginsengisoli]
MNKILVVVTVLLLAFLSCTKSDDVLSPDDFQVSTEQHTYGVGDTIRFKFSGNAENIVFWSGMPGQKYEYHNRTVAEGNTLSLNFKSFSQSGIVDQTNIKLLISTDFSGIYDSAGIKAATWRDISDRAIWSAGADQTPSGDIDLTDFAAVNKDMAIAFRYVTSEVADASVQNRWVFRSFELNSNSADGGVSTLATIGTAGWKEWSFLNPDTRWTISASQLVSNRSFTELNDDWVITKLFNPNKVAPDRGLAIKNISTSLAEHEAVYNAPGTYKVTFVASNANAVNQMTVVRELDLTITP